LPQGPAERFGSEPEQQKQLVEDMMKMLRVAMPGIIKSFDPEKQTATVQPTITENIKIGNKAPEPKELPILQDVPVHYFRAGKYSITIPVKEDDECLVVFGDSCIDGWWQSGGIQDQMETRRHDLSDAFAIVGVCSEPRAKKLKDYSIDSIRIRDEENKTFIDLKEKLITVESEEDIEVKAANEIRVTANTIDVTASSITVNCPITTFHGEIIVDVEATIGGIAFTPHKHDGVEPGGALTGTPQ
jgi:phage baseplate assembly protein gpV